MPSRVQHGGSALNQIGRHLGIRRGGPLRLGILYHLPHFLQRPPKGYVGEIPAPLIAVHDKIRIEAGDLVAVDFVEPESDMPQILGPHYQRVHVPHLPNPSAQLLEFIICPGLFQAVLRKISLIIDNAQGIVIGLGCRVHLSVYAHRVLE